MKKLFDSIRLKILLFFFDEKFAKSLIEPENCNVTYEDVSKSIFKDSSTEIDSKKGALHLSKEDIGDIEFEKRVQDDLNKKPAKMKKYAKKRSFKYKLHTISGVVLYEGDNLRKFMRETKTILPFNYKNAFYHADKHQGDKPLRDKYIITSEEIISVKN